MNTQNIMVKQLVIISFLLTFLISTPITTNAAPKNCAPGSRMTSFDYGACIDEGGDLGDIFKAGSPGNTRWKYCSRMGSLCEFPKNESDLTVQDRYIQCVQYARIYVKNEETMNSKLAVCEVQKAADELVKPVEKPIVEIAPTDCRNINTESPSASNSTQQKEAIFECLGIDSSGAKPGVKPSYCGNSSRGYYFEHLDQMDKEYGLDDKPTVKRRERDSAYQERAKYYSCLGTPCEWYSQMTASAIEEKILSCYGVTVPKPQPKPIPAVVKPVEPVVVKPTPVKQVVPRPEPIKKELEKQNSVDVDTILDAYNALIIDGIYSDLLTKSSCETKIFYGCVNKLLDLGSKYSYNSAESLCKPIRGRCLEIAKERSGQSANIKDNPKTVTTKTPPEVSKKVECSDAKGGSSGQSDCVKSDSETVNDNVQLSPEEAVADAEARLQSIAEKYWHGQIDDKEIVETTVGGKKTKVGVYPNDIFTGKNSGKFKYTVDGYSFYPTLKEAVSPSFWSRVKSWFRSKPTAETIVKEKLNAAYATYDYGSKEISRMNTIISRTGLVNLYKDYEVLRKNGSSPDKVWDSNFSTDISLVAANGGVSTGEMEKLLKKGFEDAFQATEDLRAFAK